MRARAVVGEVAAVLLGLLVVAPSARAQSLWGQSSTFIRGYVRPNDRDQATLVPFYEMVQLHGRKLGAEGLTLDASLWGLIDIVDIQDRYRVSGDISTLFLSYRAPSEGGLKLLRGLEISGGRQLVAFGPVALEQIDGGKVHYRHSSGLELGVFGGAPTGTRLAYQLWPMEQDRYDYGYNWVVGGRVGFLDLNRLAVGTSFVQRRYRGRVADNDLGIDLSYAPLPLLEISGSGTLNLEAIRAREARGSIRLQPLRKLDVALFYLYASPDLWVPRSSIFSVFSEETFQEAALDARWQTTRALSVDLGYGLRLYSAHYDQRTGTEVKNRGWLRGVLRYGPALRARLVFESDRVEAPDNAFTRVRLANSYPFQFWRRLWLTIIELETVALDELFRGTRLSFSGSGYLQVPIRTRLHLLAGGSGNFSPLLQNAGSFLVRLTWEFEAPSTATVEVRRGGLR